MSANHINSDRRRGRGSRSQSSGRYEPLTRIEQDDGWDVLACLDPIKTEVREEHSKTIISRNQSPDIPFDRSINPYRGCEHGCAYCYARPSYAYWGLSPGLDFESKLTARVNAVTLLENELAKSNYRPAPIALGANTDPYQPIERRYKLTQHILELLEKTSHPVTIVTKSALITRDIDLLARMAAQNLVQVAISITSLDKNIARKMEPRASTPEKRFEALATLSKAGIPTTIMTAPLIPALNDMELEALLEAGKDADVGGADYILLRLPLEIKDLFRDWLQEAFPDRAQHVISLLQSMRGGKDYDSEWRKRMRGEGPYADMIAQRFQLAIKRLELNKTRRPLRSDLFTPPIPKGGQMRLF